MASKPQDSPSWITEDGSPLCGFYWMRIDPKVQPNYWVQPKKLCECWEHFPTQWPVDHVMIQIPACAFRCPYCTALDNVEKEGRPCPVRVKRHINAAHIRRQRDFYMGLQISFSGCFQSNAISTRSAVKRKSRPRAHIYNVHENRSP
ncbi:unnamed protein product [Penicillium roqueforti FM164]|uniref:Genomic scaffold, ProqFM164S01 n=1 Tax=Penicillium roqueforti (strain FM164) TaxID=1365484 RepID=W6PRW3_PENRF|nr:unnamed protein product [Penicillium roqueforti FM164]